MLRGLGRLAAPLVKDSLSFSQCGEDRIVKWILEVLGIDRPRYLDVGAFDPRRLSNTFLFYALGGSGVLVEPSPSRAARIRRERPRDVCLNAGIGGTARPDAPFYVMRSAPLSTFSREEAERMVAECGEEIVEELRIPLLTPAEVLAEHFDDGIDYLSLDVEGLEQEVLEAFDLDAHRPAVLCVETLSYAIDGSGRKALPLIEHVRSRSYRVHADTFINTIFVDEDRCRGRLVPAREGQGPCSS